MYILKKFSKLIKMTSQIDLPITVVSEIIKNYLEEDVLLSKNTKIAFSRIGGVFILYLAN